MSHSTWVHRRGPARNPRCPDEKQRVRTVSSPVAQGENTPLNIEGDIFWKRGRAKNHAAAQTGPCDNGAPGGRFFVACGGGGSSSISRPSPPTAVERVCIGRLRNISRTTPRWFPPGTCRGSRSTSSRILLSDRPTTPLRPHRPWIPRTILQIVSPPSIEGGDLLRFPADGHGGGHEIRFFPRGFFLHPLISLAPIHPIIPCILCRS